MTKATRTESWTMADGRSMATLTVIVERGYGIEQKRDFCDGDVHEYDKQIVLEHTSLSLEANGKTYAGLVDMTSVYTKRNEMRGQTMMLSGNDNVLIGVSAINAPLVKAAIAEATAEAEVDPEWAEILAKRAESRAYDEHARKVERMMTLDGHTY